MNIETKKTKYEKIEEYYMSLIKENKVFPGEQLPSESEIASNFKVSRHTVRQALTNLVQNGWIYKERGKGSFFSNKKQASKSKNVAVLTTYIDEYIFPKIISGIEEQLRKKGYNLLLFCSSNDIEIEKRCIESIIQQDISGLIFEPAQSAINNLNYKEFNILKEKGIKHLKINSNSGDMDSAFIIVDDEDGGYKVTNYLLENGHKKISALFKTDDLQGVMRKQGYLNALNNEGIDINKDIIGEYTTDNESIYIYQFTKKIIDMKDRPSAIVCYNDKIASQVINICREVNIQIPKDLSITSFDDSHIAVSSDTKLTTIKHPKEDMGEKAAKCIIDMIEGRIKKSQYVYEAELIVRNSCNKI